MDGDHWKHLMFYQGVPCLLKASRLDGSWGADSNLGSMTSAHEMHEAKKQNDQGRNASQAQQ